jgi:hypothetical protein
VKRDRERIRNLLIRLENSPEGHIQVAGYIGPSDEEKLDEYHLTLMGDEDLVMKVDDGVWRLTSVGHDAAEAIGQIKFWEKLKSAGPAEAYDLLKGATSSLAFTALSRLLGWS